MVTVISIFDFVCKKRSFGFLFVVFTAIYFCLFLGLFFSLPEAFSEITFIQAITAGIFLPLSGGLMASLAWKLVTWRARESLEIQKEKMK